MAVTTAQVLADVAELFDSQRLDPTDLVYAIGLAAAVVTPTGREARDLAEDIMSGLARHLCFPPDQDAALALTAWTNALTREQIVAELRGVAKVATESEER